MSYLISVPAGRAFRRENSKWVDPQPEKGLIQMKLEDDLMQLCESLSTSINGQELSEYYSLEIQGNQSR